jgi:hypothetical protein
MAPWRCFKCQNDMVEVSMHLYFEGIEGDIEGIQCPKCGTKYLLEKTVIEKVNKVEEQISLK